MMDRGQLKRSSTLIDPASLQTRPTPNRVNSAGSNTQLQRKGSRSGKPLLTFGEDGQLAETTAMEVAAQQPQPQQQLTVPGSRAPRIPKAHSVFGADKLWEREMERLEVIKAQEKVEEEERRIREEAEEAKRAKKKGRGKKKHGKHEEIPVEPASPVEDETRLQAVTQPLLPDITKVSSRRRTAPIPVEDDSDDESSASEAGSRPTGARDDAAEKWVSDDEEGGKSKIPGMAGMHSNSQFGGSMYANPADDSDEDMPLSMALQRSSKNLMSTRSAYQDESDSDEDMPLSTLLSPSKSKHAPPSFDLDHAPSPRSPHSQQKVQSFNDDDDEEEDNVPLGIRASHIPTMASSFFSQSGGARDEDEDDRPLAMHPEQVRKSQYQVFAQMQQQQADATTATNLRSTDAELNDVQVP